MTTTNIILSSKVRSSIFRILGSKAFKVQARQKGLYRMEINVTHNEVGYVKSWEDYTRNISQEEVLREIYKKKEFILETLQERIEAKQLREEKEAELKTEVETYSVAVNGTNYYSYGYSDGYNDNFCTYADSVMSEEPDFPNSYAKEAYNKGYQRGSYQGAMDT